MPSAVKRSLDHAGFVTYGPVSRLLTSTELASPVFSHIGTFCGFFFFLNAGSGLHRFGFLIKTVGLCTLSVSHLVVSFRG